MRPAGDTTVAVDFDWKSRVIFAMTMSVSSLTTSALKSGGKVDAADAGVFTGIGGVPVI